MNFSEIQDIENKVAMPNSAPTSAHHMEVLADYLQFERNKLLAKETPFVYFYEDVISASLAFNFQEALGETCFKNASDDARSCLNISNEFCKLSSWITNAWLLNALKFADNIVLHYIQDHCSEIPKKYPNIGIEKSRYIHLSEKAGDASAAGANLVDLYNLRNDLEHRTKVHSDGRHELLPPQRNKVRREVVKLYRKTLESMLKTYANAFPHLSS